MWLGFAAGCAAAALPRRSSAFSIWAEPLVRPLAQLSDGLSPDQGHSPQIILAAAWGIASADEVNSGGIAEPDMPVTFEANLALVDKEYRFSS